MGIGAIWTFFLVGLIRLFISYMPTTGGWKGTGVKKSLHKIIQMRLKLLASPVETPLPTVHNFT